MIRMMYWLVSCYRFVFWGRVPTRDTPTKCPVKLGVFVGGDSCPPVTLNTGFLNHALVGPGVHKG
jgi:hypothetical protein